MDDEQQGYEYVKQRFANLIHTMSADDLKMMYMELMDDYQRNDNPNAKGIANYLREVYLTMLEA